MQEPQGTTSVDSVPTHAFIPFWLACNRKIDVLCSAEALSNRRLQAITAEQCKFCSLTPEAILQSVLLEKRTLLFHMVSCLCRLHKELWAL